MITVGCRLNQSESDALRARLRAEGVTLVAKPAEADVCYVNTCAVTGAAERTSVKHVRRACAFMPRAQVVALGCLAQSAPERLRRIDGVIGVWDNDTKQAAVARTVPEPGRSRAILKVQDGCGAGCAYCLPGRLRGAPCSVPAQDVLARFRALLDAGFAEVVLTGLNLALYEGGLGRLLVDLLETPGEYRIRLASVEPAAFDEELFRVIGDGRICPHFHVPLQSADDLLLAAMGRGYTSGQFAELARRLKRIRPDANIGADIIAGFPSEDDASHERGFERLGAMLVDYLHVFPYSPRPGTSAAALGDPVPRAVKRQRVHRLRSLSDRRRSEYATRFLDTERVIVVEPGLSGITDNYLRLRLLGGPEKWPGPRRLVRAAIEREKDCLFGRPVTAGRVC